MSVNNKLVANDDEVIRKRLMVDGDGGGDERRLTALLKLYIKWCKTKEVDHSTHQRMLSFLTQSECSITKASLVYQMNNDQQKKYQKLQEEIDDNVELAHSEIEKCKRELEEAKLVRRNRQQYDVMAEVVLQQPDRIRTEHQIRDTRTELADLATQERQLVEKLNQRKKQCHALLTSISQLQSILKEERDQEDHQDQQIMMDGVEESVDVKQEKLDD